MHKLSPPEHDPLALYDAIAGAKHEPTRATLKGLRSRLVCAYARYYTHKPAFEKIRPLGRRIGPDESAALVHAYEKQTAPMKRLYAELKHGRRRCPYCTIDSVSDLDHYLSKDRYPEFAVLPVNLVPSCGKCNPPRTRIENRGLRFLVHPYFDEVPKRAVIVAVVSVVDGVPEADFTVDRTGTADPAFVALYARHFEELDLQARYREQAASEVGLSGIVSMIRSFPFDTSANASAFLLRQAELRVGDLGENHFDVVLLRGAAASVDFLDFCLRGAA